MLIDIQTYQGNCQIYLVRRQRRVAAVVASRAVEFLLFRKERQPKDELEKVSNSTTILIQVMSIISYIAGDSQVSSGSEPEARPVPSPVSASYEPAYPQRTPQCPAWTPPGGGGGGGGGGRWLDY